jgi:hypothetical protein
MRHVGRAAAAIAAPYRRPARPRPPRGPRARARREVRHATRDPRTRLPPPRLPARGPAAVPALLVRASRSCSRPPPLPPRPPPRRVSANLAGASDRATSGARARSGVARSPFEPWRSPCRAGSDHARKMRSARSTSTFEQCPPTGTRMPAARYSPRAAMAQRMDSRGTVTIGLLGRPTTTRTLGVGSGEVNRKERVRRYARDKSARVVGSPSREGPTRGPHPAVARGGPGVRRARMSASNRPLAGGGSAAVVARPDARGARTPRSRTPARRPRDRASHAARRARPR